VSRPLATRAIRGLAAALAVAASALPGSAPASPPFLGSVELDAPARPGPPPWEVTLTVTGVRREMLAELEARYGEVAFDGERVRLAVRGYPAPRSGPTAEDRESSFWVDPDEPEIQALRPEVVAEAGPRPRARDLADFVAAYIVDKDLSRAFDPASVVARRRQGDCTEHAVLLAALCRLFGLPARVVTGFVVLTEGEGAPYAAGHAWVEVFEGGRWALADATELWDARPVHLPLQTMRGSGPGLLVADPKILTLLHVKAVAVRPLGAAAAAR
jgi:transglutaminase-like putative cysteine protease